MTIVRRIGTTLVALIILVGAVSTTSAQELPWREEPVPARQETTMVVGEHQIDVILAISPWQQSLGLGYRNGLETDQGMLFVYGDPQERSFWMRGMRFCIDIIWITDGQIVGAAESVCPDPPGTADADRARYPSGVPVTHVLEMPAGWLAEHGYGPGTPVTLPEGLGDG